jgi:hypothetical protein
MKKIKYNKNLDSISEIEKMAEFYDKADLSDYCDTKASARTKKLALTVRFLKLLDNLKGPPKK